MHYGTDRVPERLAATRATPNHPKTARVGLVLTQKLLRSLQPRNDAVGSVHPCLQSTQLLADLRDLFGCHGGVWVFRTVRFERVVLSSPGRVWPGRMDDREEVLEAHA